jgi:hypothetical protein
MPVAIISLLLFFAFFILLVIGLMKPEKAILLKKFKM